MVMNLILMDGSLFWIRGGEWENGRRGEQESNNN